jgi:hypothetical protein
MAVNDVWETIATWVHDREQAECVFHHLLSAENQNNTNETAAGLLAELTTHLTDVTNDTMTADTHLVAIATHRVKGAAGTSRYFTSFPVSVIGSVTADHVGGIDAVLISKYTATNTRQGRGRMYLPFVSETYVGDGKIKSASLSDLETAVEKILLTIQTDAENNEWTPAVFSKVGNAAAAIEEIVVRPVLVTQRRRSVRKQGYD